MFTPVSGLGGGALIGASAGTLLLLNGNVLGASGIYTSCILSIQKTFRDPKEQWKLAFVASFLLTSKAIINVVSPDDIVDSNIGSSPNLPVVSAMGYGVAGFLVGLGTRLGNGCTSGHGICGLARFSKRSFAAVVTFMVTGVTTATVFSSTFSLAKYLHTTGVDAAKHAVPTELTERIGSIITALSVCVAIASFFRSPSEKTKESEDDNNGHRKLVPAGISGALFSIGLYVSKMMFPSKIFGFLDMKGFSSGTYDPTLILVMGGGLVTSLISYQFVKGFNVIKNDSALSCPLALKKTSGTFNVPTSKVIDSPLVIGEFLFGLGWGIAGVCPGPAMFQAAAGHSHILYRWWPSYIVGSYLAQKIKERCA